MAKAWKIIITVFLIFALLGLILFLVGLMTGADFGRIFHAVAEEYGLVDDPQVYVDWFGEVIHQVIGMLPLDTLFNSGILID